MLSLLNVLVSNRNVHVFILDHHGTVLAGIETIHLSMSESITVFQDAAKQNGKEDALYKLAVCAKKKET